MSVTVTVVGTPAGQGSKRFVGRRLIESSPHTRPWRDAVRASTVDKTGGATPFPAGPVTVDIQVYVPRPKNHYGTGRNALRLRDTAPPFPAGTPDLDKIARACLDALTDAALWRDDNQVSLLHIDKQWAQDYGRPPGARIVIAERTTTRGPLTI